jgi:hypothetical protein
MRSVPGSVGSMLRYINRRLCAAFGMVSHDRSSASFYYILGECGSAGKTGWCNAPKSA